jgi:hypothetical protein
MILVAGAVGVLAALNPGGLFPAPINSFVSGAFFGAAIAAFVGLIIYAALL